MPLRQVVGPKGYSEEDMSKAVTAVKKKLMTVRKASAKYSVPKSTLMDCVSSKHSSKQGRPKVLSDLEESLIIERVKVEVLN
jgi:hypothetical protein